MNDEWETPLDLFITLDKEFKFEVDLCAQEHNRQVTEYSSDILDFMDNLDEMDNFKSFWMNPPYSRGNIGMCMEQAYTLSKLGKTVVCLVRLDPSAKWFQQWVDGKALEVRMLDKRVKFQGASDSYNFPCCIVVYEGDLNKQGLLHTDYNIWGWVDE